MRTVFLSLALVAIIVSSTMLPEVRLKTSASFAQLQKTRVGRNIFTAIQLELSSNQSNIVDRILVLLHELLDQTVNTLDQTEQSLKVETQDCNDARQSLEGQITDKQGQIDQGNQDLPILRLEKSSDETNQQNQQERHDQAVRDLADADDVNNKSVAIHAKATRNHNAMVDALQQARALIITLKSSSFIQKSSNKILAQLTAHTNSSLAALEAHPNRDLYQVLMQMAQEVAVQADQEMVGSVVEIIDDLLRAEADALESESAAENDRIAEYNQRVIDLNHDIEETHGEVLRLESEITNLGNQIEELENNLNKWNDQLNSLNQALLTNNNLCSSQIAALNAQIVDLNSEIDVIKQVIAIFEGQSIQDIRSVVNDFSYEEN